VSLSYVAGDLDAFTHFGGLAFVLSLARVRKLSSRTPRVLRAAVGVLLLATSISLSAQATTAENLKPLFTPAPQALGTEFFRERVTSVESVILDASLIGLSAFTVNVEGRELLATRVASEVRVSSEMFLYRVEGGDFLSVFTRTYDGIVLGHIQTNGKGYFISGAGGNHLVVSGLSVPVPEVVHYPMLEEPVSLALSLSTTPARRRAVRSGPLPVTVYMNIAICLDYRDAVGGEAKAIARATHMIDRLNNAYRSSGFSGRVEIREIAFVDPPAEFIPTGLYKWATDPSGIVVANRKRTKAAGTIVLSKNALVAEAIRTAPRPIDPNREVAIAAGFFAEWDDGDIHIALHEVGHLSGGDHNPESSTHPPDDPQISARDWYSCEESVYGALSYNVCDKFLNRVEMFSGLNAVYAGRVRGNERQDNVGTFVRVFEYLKGAHE
jgi:hypothetical protein